MKILVVASVALVLAVNATPAPEDAAATPVRGLVIWQDPGSVEALDLKTGAGGTELAPHPPFMFEEEVLSGTTPKVKVKDAAGRSYVVKWGDEAHAAILASRLAWAAGYFTIPIYFVPAGEIQGLGKLVRADKRIDDGRFSEAAFQLWQDGLVETDGWKWKDNPFISRVPGARELNGLKILMMLTSNWDNKDARDFTRGSNTAVRKVTTPTAETRYEYMVSDWGGTMGKWGGFFQHNKWDCQGYAEESQSFVKGVSGGEVQWGYNPAQYTGDMVEDITVEDVQWLMQYLGKLTDGQLRDAATASGASPEAVVCYTQAIRQRIEQMRAITQTTSK